MAIHLGLAEPDTSHFSIQAGNNPAEHYYGHLLNLAEKLFEAEIDAATFEESLRVMFGTKAYVMFTLDRVVAAIVKAVSAGCKGERGGSVKGREEDITDEFRYKWSARI